MTSTFPKLTKLLMRAAMVSSSFTAGSAGYLLYEYKEFRDNPWLIIKGINRFLRFGTCSIKLLNIYKNPFSNNTDEEKNIEAGKVICKTLIKNSGSSIKMGQVLAMMDMLFPQELTDQLTSLFQQAPLSQIENIKYDIAKSFNTPFNEIFASFNETPIASGSIAQVYEAVLKKNNQRVAVKVRHSFLKESLELDLTVIRFFVELGSTIDDNFNYRWLYDDGSVNLRKETDFNLESDNIDKISALMKNTKGVVFPKVVKEFSNDGILTMDFIDGYSITDVDRLKKDKISLDSLARIMAETFAKMIFEFGFVHADPHPGNVFIQKNDKNSFDIVLLDNGLYAALSEKTRINYAAMWKGIITRNEPLIIKSTTNLGVGFAFQLFTSMITSQTYEKSMSNENNDIKIRLKGKSPADQKREETRILAQTWRHEIMECLEKMNRDMILLFKINNYIESIDTKLGQPINNYWYTTIYSFNNHVWNNQFNVVSKIITRIQLMNVLFWLKIYEWSLMLKKTG